MRNRSRFLSAVSGGMGYEAAKEGLLTYPGNAQSETWTYGHSTGTCRKITSGVSVEAGLYQFRWYNNQFTACALDYSGIMTGGYATADASCTPGGLNGDYVYGTHRVWISGGAHDSTGELEGHV